MQSSASDYFGSVSNMKFIRFIKQTKNKVNTEVKREQRKLNKQEKVKKAPRIEDINLQNTSIAKAITLENTLTEHSSRN